MSIKMLSWALEQNVGDSTAKLVLISICDAHNGENGACHPSKARIATQASCSIETVTRKLKWLEENGWIESIPRYDNSGRQTSNSYRICMDEGGGVNLGRVPMDDMGEGVNCDTPLKRTVIRNRKNTVSDKPDTAFEDMWKTFPKSGFPSKQNALKAYSKLSEDDRLACCAGAKAYTSWHEAEKRRRQDTPAVHLATFINQRRWEAVELNQAGKQEVSKVDRIAYLKKGVWLPEWGPKPELTE